MHGCRLTLSCRRECLPRSASDLDRIPSLCPTREAVQHSLVSWRIQFEHDSKGDGATVAASRALKVGARRLVSGPPRSYTPSRETVADSLIACAVQHERGSTIAGGTTILGRAVEIACRIGDQPARGSAPSAPAVNLQSRVKVGTDWAAAILTRPDRIRSANLTLAGGQALSGDPNQGISRCARHTAFSAGWVAAWLWAAAKSRSAGFAIAEAGAQDSVWKNCAMLRNLL
jgi:hypothetical protein